jgi:Organic Anion Transporter Polypeptide (OATP) family
LQKKIINNYENIFFIRCVEKRDKAIAMGLTTAVVSMFAIVPSPTFFGWIIDR